MYFKALWRAGLITNGDTVLFEVFVRPWNGARQHVAILTAIHKSSPLQTWKGKDPYIVRFMVWYGF